MDFVKRVGGVAAVPGLFSAGELSAGRAGLSKSPSSGGGGGGGGTSNVKSMHDIGASFLGELTSRVHARRGQQKGPMKDPVAGRAASSPEAQPLTPFQAELQKRLRSRSTTTEDGTVTNKESFDFRVMGESNDADRNLSAADVRTGDGAKSPEPESPPPLMPVKVSELASAAASTTRQYTKARDPDFYLRKAYQKPLADRVSQLFKKQAAAEAPVAVPVGVLSPRRGGSSAGSVEQVAAENKRREELAVGCVLVFDCGLVSFVRVSLRGSLRGSLRVSFFGTRRWRVGSMHEFQRKARTRTPPHSGFQQ
jgi:hypothetical protein